MNKGELIDSIAKQSGLTKADSARALDACLDAVTGALMTGDKVTLPGFGTFGTSKRSARSGRNPQTGATINIPASKAPRFKAGKALKEAVQ